MPKVVLKHQYETFASLFRRFNKAVDKSGIMQDFRDHEFYEKPSSKKKKARAAAVKREQREQAERNAPVIFDVEE